MLMGSMLEEPKSVRCCGCGKTFDLSRLHKDIDYRYIKDDAGKEHVECAKCWPKK